MVANAIAEETVPKKLKSLHRSSNASVMSVIKVILLIKTTAAQNEVALSYHKLRGLYFLAVVYATNIECIRDNNTNHNKCWSHIAPFSRLYLVDVVVQLKSQR